MPFSFELSKVEVINTNLTKFQVKFPVERPLIYNVKIRFANKALVVVACCKPTFLISACVVVLVLGYMGSKLRMIGLGGVGGGGGDLSLHLRLSFASEPRTHMSRNSSRESQAFVKRVSTGNRLLSPSRLRTHMSRNSSFES